MMRTARIATFRNVWTRAYSSTATPRHLMNINDLKLTEFNTLIHNAASLKAAIKAGKPSSVLGSLTGKSIAMMFSKRSTRTRVSTEAAVALMRGHPMFLGKDDIQLGVNESLYDTSVVISSMVSGMVARVGPHSDVTGLAKHSSVPVINALSDDFHPLQIIADFLTVYEAFALQDAGELAHRGLKVAWIGDSNNILFDLATACIKAGVNIAVASPQGYGIPEAMRRHILSAREGASHPGSLTETVVPEEAAKDANILVTDTWVSMGQEAETQKRLKAFDGYQITRELAKRAGAKPNWKFMHCLPRHPQEVDDEVFYGPRSLVFPEAENRLWAVLAVLQAFVVNNGLIEPSS